MTNESNSRVISAKTAQEGETIYLASCDACGDDVAFAEVLTEGGFDWRTAFPRRLREVFNATLTDARENAHGSTPFKAALYNNEVNTNAT